MTNIIPEAYYDLLDGPVVVMVATVMPDNQPQVTPVWCNRKGNQIWINSARGRQKDRNMRARPQVTIAATDPNNPYRWLEVRGNVVEIVDDPTVAWDHINGLSHEYAGRDFGASTNRVIYKIEPTKVNASG